MRHSALILAGVGLTLSLAGCGDPDRAERANPDRAEMDDDVQDDLVDVEEVIAAAMRYEDDLMQLSLEAEQSETHADAASVFVWGSADVADLYHSIDPDDPTQAVDFPQGTTFIKEHFDEAGDLAGLTLMYKAPPGYNPDARDWMWARIRGDETTHSGRVEWCSDCHNAAHNTDFVVGFGKSP